MIEIRFQITDVNGIPYLSGQGYAKGATSLELEANEHLRMAFIKEFNRWKKERTGHESSGTIVELDRKTDV